MKAYTISSSWSAMSVARGAIGSWRRSPGSSDGDSCSPGVWPALISALQGMLIRRPTPSLALPVQVTGDTARFSELGAGRGVSPGPAWLLCVSGEPAAAAAPQHITDPAEEDEGSDDAQPDNHVIDGGHEVVRRVAQCGRKAPVVCHRRRRCRRCFGHRDGQGAEGGVVVEILDLAFELLDLARDLGDLVLHRDQVVDVLGLGQEGQHCGSLRFGVVQASLQVEVLRAHLGAGDLLVLDLSNLRKLVNGRVKV